MNVAENMLLQQMQSMVNLPKTGNTGGNEEQAGGFKDLMEQAGQDAAVETGNEADTPEQPVQEDQSGGRTEEKTAPVQKKPGEEEKPQELHGDPNAVNFAPDFFRPEIVDISAEPEVTLEVPVETVSAEIIPEAAGVPADTAAADAAPIAAEQEAPAEDAAAEPQAAPEITPETETAVQETVKPAENQRPAEKAPEAPAPEKPVEQTTETGELRETRPAEKNQEDGTQQGEAMQLPPQQVFQDAEAAPVKVAENYEPVDTQDVNMDGKLAEKILQAAENGAEKIQIQLSPENLGALTIELSKDANGALQVVLHASNSRAAGLLSQHLDGLHTALQSYGTNQSVHVEVQRGQESQEQHMFQHADPDGRGRQQQQQEDRKEREDSGEDFLQRLRLGLTALDE